MNYYILLGLFVGLGLTILLVWLLTHKSTPPPSPSLTNYMCKNGGCFLDKDGTMSETTCRSGCNTYNCSTTLDGTCVVVKDGSGVYSNKTVCENDAKCLTTTYNCNSPKDGTCIAIRGNTGAYSDQTTCESSCTPLSKFTCDKTGGTGCVASATGSDTIQECQDT